MRWCDCERQLSQNLMVPQCLHSSKLTSKEGEKGRRVFLRMQVSQQMVIIRGVNLGDNCFKRRRRKYNLSGKYIYQIKGGKWKFLCSTYQMISILNFKEEKQLDSNQGFAILGWYRTVPWWLVYSWHWTTLTALELWHTGITSLSKVTFPHRVGYLPGCELVFCFWTLSFLNFGTIRNTVLLLFLFVQSIGGSCSHWVKKRFILEY